MYTIYINIKINEGDLSIYLSEILFFTCELLAGTDVSLTGFTRGI